MTEPIGWPQNAYVGQKVVCLRGDWNVAYAEIKPTTGKVYTIRALDADADGVGVRLEEIVNRVGCYQQDGRIKITECFFDARGFRPVQSTETGFKLLTALLVTNKQKEPA